MNYSHKYSILQRAVVFVLDRQRCTHRLTPTAVRKLPRSVETSNGVSVVSVCRNANAKALKVTGLTVLACLLLAGQALTAYLVWGQKEHINALTSGQEKLKTELTRKMSGENIKHAIHLQNTSSHTVKLFLQDL